MTTAYCLVLCTCPGGEEGAALARFLVEENLAACVNVLPAVQSFYRWEGQLESAHESLLLIKTERALYPQLENRLRQRHPYQLPEIIALPLAQGLPDYFQWISSCLRPVSSAS